MFLYLYINYKHIKDIIIYNLYINYKDIKIGYFIKTVKLLLK